MPLISSSFRLASLFGFFSAFGLGCVISLGNTTSAGDLECGDLLAHNDANCVCDPGYERCNPTSETDKSCCEKEPKPGTCDDPNSELVGNECFCKVGFTWCSSDPADLSCCEDPGQTSQGTGGTGGETDSGTGGTTMEVPTTSEGTTGPAECPNPATPPASCDEATEAFFCTHPKSCGPQGSTYYVCEGGVYVDQTASIDQQCQLDGYDFGYGCVDEPAGVFVECGNGSGEACQGTGGTCMSDTVFAGCKWGKQSEVDCFVQCTEVGDEMGVLYDYGSCGEQDGVIACLCCDEGEEGCPINDTGGDTGGSTGA